MVRHAVRYGGEFVVLLYANISILAVQPLVETIDMLGNGDTAGIDVTNANLGGQFASGVFFAHDNDNSGHSISNIKLVSWADAADEITPNLIIDTSWDPRGVGQPLVPGDTNNDRIVDDLDYVNFVAQFGGPPGAESADFNDDGIVNLIDFAIMRSNFESPAATAPGVESAPLPEPATLVLLATGGLAALRKRRG